MKKIQSAIRNGGTIMEELNLENIEKKEMSVDDVINKYVNLDKDYLQGERAWEDCHNYFSTLHKLKIRNFNGLSLDEQDLACKTLGFYLASCGEYDRNPFLKHYDCFIYRKIISELLNEKYDINWDLDVKTIILNNYGNFINYPLREIVDILHEFKEKVSIKDSKNIKKEKCSVKKISDEEMRLGIRILFATMCCIPSYNKYFIIGLKDEKYEEFENYKTLLQSVTFSRIFEDASKKYNLPFVKIIDIYFSYIGKKISRDITPFERYMHIY